MSDSKGLRQNRKLPFVVGGADEGGSNKAHAYGLGNGVLPPVGFEFIKYFLPVKPDRILAYVQHYGDIVVCFSFRRPA